MRVIYYNSENNRVLVDGFGYHSPKTLEAWDDGNEVSIRLINTSNNLLSEPYTEFYYEDETTTYGSTKQEVIDNLNEEFNKNADLEWSFTNEVTVFVNTHSPGQLGSVNSLLNACRKEVRLYEKMGNSEPLLKRVNNPLVDEVSTLSFLYPAVPPLTLTAFILSLLT